MIRPILVLTGFACLTLPLMPIQWVLNALNLTSASKLPHRYHKWVCRLLGISVFVDGQVFNDKPVLLVANHVSWLDIPILSSIAPISFIAKKEVSNWPFVGWLAKLQRTIFIDREKRSAVGETATEITNRLVAGEFIVLFAEGTSNDGNIVLPFRSALFGAIQTPGANIEVQTISIAYTKLHGIPVGREGRPRIAWYGDMEMADHAWQLLKAGPIDVHVKFGSPITFSGEINRKQVANLTEKEVRRNVAELLKNGVKR